MKQRTKLIKKIKNDWLQQEHRYTVPRLQDKKFILKNNFDEEYLLEILIQQSQNKKKICINRWHVIYVCIIFGKKERIKQHDEGFSGFISQGCCIYT